MTRMKINGSETGTLRLFHLDLPPEAVDRFTVMAGTGEWPLKYALGATKLREAFVDVVDIRDLGDMPLSRYMAEAHGAAGEDFKASRPQIDALRGHVVILPSQAFDGTSQDLTIAAPLRWIGTFSEDKPKPRGARIKSDAAKGQGGAAPGEPPARGNSALLKLILLGIGIVVLLVLAMMLRG